MPTATLPPRTASRLPGRLPGDPFDLGPGGPGTPPGGFGSGGDGTGGGSPGTCPVIVLGTHPSSGNGPVLAAVDDDGSAGEVLRHGYRLAARLGVGLRAAYVWSACRTPDCSHHRHCHRDLAEADRLLGDVIGEHLTADTARRLERDIVHADDPAEALVALSDSASMLVVGASGDGRGSSAALGATTRALLGRTRCPVVVVPRSRA